MSSVKDIYDCVSKIETLIAVEISKHIPMEDLDPENENSVSSDQYEEMITTLMTILTVLPVKVFSQIVKDGDGHLSSIIDRYIKGVIKAKNLYEEKNK